MCTIPAMMLAVKMDEICYYAIQDLFSKVTGCKINIYKSVTEKKIVSMNSFIIAMPIPKEYLTKDIKDLFNKNQRTRMQKLIKAQKHGKTSHIHGI